MTTENEQRRRILDPDATYTLPEITDPQKILEIQLSTLAGNWRQTKDQKFVDEYHDVYRQLLAMGWNGNIDVDAMLPDRLMPKE